MVHVDPNDLIPEIRNPSMDEEDSFRPDHFVFPRLDFESSTSFRGGARRSQQQVNVWTLFAVGVDVMFCLGIGLLLAALLISASQDRMTFGQLSSQSLPFLGLFLVCLVNYLLIFRAFLGFTIGEWACNLRLGTAEEYNSSRYLARVLKRTLLVGLTFGFIHILSVFLKNDLSGRFSGLKLISLK